MNIILLLQATAEQMQEPINMALLKEKNLFNLTFWLALICVLIIVIPTNYKANHKAAETETLDTSTENNNDLLIPPHNEKPLQLQDNQSTPISDNETEQEEEEEPYLTDRIIESITVVGNKYAPTDAILNNFNYQIGEIYNPLKSGQAIRTLYTTIPRFRNITLKGTLFGDDKIGLTIVVEEKKPLKEIVFSGNKHLSEADMKKKISLDMQMIDVEEMPVIARQIQKLYREKGYNDVKIESEFLLDPTDVATIKFTITEGHQSVIKQILFKGNDHISSKELKLVLFTKEDWLLSFLDKAGTYDPEKLEGDKYMIEQLYQNAGYVQAHVTDINIDEDPITHAIKLTYEIEEGAQYTIASVHAQGNDLLSEEQLLSVIPIFPGDVFSRETISKTIKRLEQLWGNFGYIFASVEPSILPDDEKKIIDLSFITDLGKRVNLRRITIKGNKKTRDKVIRRRLVVHEGEPLSSTQLESSKSAVEALGYFEQREGVHWKINRINDELVDLELLLQEAKTGHANVQISFGGQEFKPSTPWTGAQLKASISDSNLWGTGILVNFEGSYANNEQTVNFHIAQNYLFDKPITTALDFFHRRPTYDQLININPKPVTAKQTGGIMTAGYITQPYSWLLPNTTILSSLSIENVTFNELVRANLRDPLANALYQQILNKEFMSGDFITLACAIEQDRRNHPIYPSRGVHWNISSKVAIPSLSGNIAYGRVAADAHWYTPLIDEYNLIFHLHGFAGVITTIGDRSIPYGELYNVGGEGSVRGYLWGQLGPRFFGDPIGSKNSFFVNAELIFPVAPDMSIRGVAFYDGGTGWKNPYINPGTSGLTGNNFDYRHSVGLGVRILRPMPLKIDWGFKLDPRTGESSSEIHFGSSMDW